MACTAGSSPSEPFDTFETSLIAYADTGLGFILQGVGTRDLATSGIASLIVSSIPAGATIVRARLYLSDLSINPFQGYQVLISFNGGGFTITTPTGIAWTNDSGWLAADDGNWLASANDQNIYNHISAVDITGLISGNGNGLYEFKLGTIRGAGQATALMPDEPYYPGCDGSNGLALLIVYKNPSDTTARQIKIYEGAKLLDASGIFGTTASYPLNFNIGTYYNSPQVAYAVADPKTNLTDSFCINGVTCVTPNGFGSAINPTDGNSLDTNYLNNVCLNSGSNTATMSVESDIFVWFLFVVQGDQAQCSPVASLPGSLNLFKNEKGSVDYVTGGIGTRDQDLAVTPANFVVNVPGKPLEAYLYWNVFVSDTVDASKAILNSVTYTGTMVGKCGNTCWSSPNNCGNADQSYDPGMKNQVWRADITNAVSASVPNGGNYSLSVKVPNVHYSTLIAFNASDSPHFPGCSGSQGVVLLVIYQTNCSYEKNIIIYDGAALLVPSAGTETYGGMPEYAITITPDLPDVSGNSACARITLGIGDAQTTYADSFFWNGTPLPQNASSSYANPNKGNLLSLADNTVTVNVGSNTIQGTTTNDCLSWFLFAYSGITGYCASAPNPTAPKDQLSFFRGFQGDVDFTGSCIGIRDVDTNVHPVTLSSVAPGPIVAAYLYWNVIGARGWYPSTAVVNGHTVLGCLLGWGGNTCWSVCNNEINVINKTYRADVTSLARSASNLLVSIPTQSVDGTTSTAGMVPPQIVHIPGCCSGQGIVLLLIYNTPHVSMPQPSCCATSASCGLNSCVKQTVLTTRRQILIYDGGVTVSPVGGPDSDPPNYSVVVNSQYKNNIKILTGVGDSQTAFSDDLYWDGVPFPTNAYRSYFNNECGNLLQASIQQVAGSGQCDCTYATHTASIAQTPPSPDCLYWFLYVYSADNTFLDSTMKVTRKK